MDKKIFSKGMAVLRATYPTFEKIAASKEALETWFMLLQDLDDASFLNALKIICMNNKYHPTIAEIRETAKALNTTPTLSAEEAWGILVNDVHRHGWYNEPTYADKILERSKRAIGWETLCDMTEGTKMGTRAHFIKTYNSMIARDEYTAKFNTPEARALDDFVARKLTGEIGKIFKELEPGDKAVGE